MNAPDSLLDLCRELQHVQNQAKAQGLFVGDRELLDCPHCGLFEDVTAEGLLVTSYELRHPLVDTGLRFRLVSAKTFQCPACATSITLKNQDHGQAE